MTVRSSIRNLYLFILIFISVGCVGTRYLDDGEFLLYEQQIKSAQRVDEGELSDFYRQQPNRRLPILPVAPYVWLYQVGLNSYDLEEIEQEMEEVREKYEQKIAAAQNKSKEKKVERLRKKEDEKLAKLERTKEEGTLFMRWGEPLSIYDSSQAEVTRQQMESYLHTKGFFDGEVTHNAKIDDRQVTSEYTVIEKEPYRIDSIAYLSEDTTILSLIMTELDNKVIRQNQIYDQDELGRLRENIENLLKNNGYYDFSRQYVEFRVDSTIGEREVMVYTVIREPAKRGYHKQFKLDSIIFTTDADVRGHSGERQVSTFNDITYRYHEYQYYKKILGRRILINKDSLYNRQQTLETQRQLSNLDIFKFININYDTTDGKFITNIYASPLKKFQTSTEVGLNVSQGLPGPFVNASLQVRNVFGGLEILELSGRAGIEGVPPVIGQAGSGSGSGAFPSREAGGNLSLTFPQFIAPLPEQWKQDLGRLNPKTRLQTGYSYVDRPEYSRTNFQTSMAYTWQKGQKVQYVFTPVDFNFIDSKIQLDTFQTILNNSLETYGIPLNRSFEPSFVTSTSFTTTFNFNNYGSNSLLEGGGSGTPSYLRLFLESGGTLLNFFGTEALDNANLAYFKFLKFNPDFRQYISLSNDKTLAYRVNIGIAYPYNKNPDDRVLPYEKYFFAGGSNSIRAWRPRRLGPGSISPDSLSSSGYFVYNLEQPGEILLETSIEYRQKLFGFINGALFVDAGNVWRIADLPDTDGTRQGSAKFALNTFIPQIAIGAGAGLRFDFSFLILRFDYGVKVYDPARASYDPESTEDTGRWIGQKFDVWEEVRNGVLNIGIGYPF